MTLTFLTPVGAAVAASALVPIGALILHERRLRRLRAELRLEQPPLRSRLPSLLALAAIPALVGLALTQPVIRTTRAHLVRKDAEAVYVVDISRSMLASTGQGGATRFERAARAALRMRVALSSIPSGIASMSDRVEPHVFPTANEEVFAAALQQSLRVENPPPRGLDEVGTLFESLDQLAGDTIFDPGVKHRLAIVLTDGESRPYYVPTLRDALAAGPQTDFVIVRFWHPDERVWAGEGPEPGYRADRNSAQMTAQLASITHGAAFEERDVGRAISEARRAVGDGPVAQQGETLRVISLARWIALAALLPLALLLWRRNLV